jgi:hypothetical protein
MHIHAYSLNTLYLAGQNKIELLAIIINIQSGLANKFRIFFQLGAEQGTNQHLKTSRTYFLAFQNFEMGPIQGA